MTSQLPMMILLVDDNEADVKIAVRGFEKAALKTNLRVVQDGQAGLDYVRNEGDYQNKERYPRPDLILLDIHLPKRNGFEVLECLKADPGLRSIPVVVLTSSKNEKDIERSFDLGAASYLPKPLEYEQFVKLVHVFNQYWQEMNKLPARR